MDDPDVGRFKGALKMTDMKMQETKLTDASSRALNCRTRK